MINKDTIAETRLLLTRLKNKFLWLVSAKPGEGRLQRIVRISWLSFTGLVLSVFLYFKAVEYNFLYLFGELPSLEKLEKPKIPIASELYTADGVLIGRYYRENRSPVVYEQLPRHLVDALVATEDVRFYQHAGVDFKAMVSVLWYAVRGDRRGGSTITQQLAKNLFKTRLGGSQGLLGRVPVLRTLVIKTKEWITAVKLEREYTKEEIITMYFNTVDFGSNAFGIKTAAKTFFGITPEKLSVEQAAVLVGLLNAPSKYSPILNPENALERRNTVFRRMVTYNSMKQADCDLLSKRPIQLKVTIENFEDGAATYFKSVMNNYLKEWCEEKGLDLYADGLRIYSTIDSRIQNLAEDAVAEHIRDLQRKFFQHWRGMNPWVDKRNKEIPDYIEKAISQTEMYRQLVKRYGTNSDSIDILLNTPKRMKVFSWYGERDTTMSPIDSVRYYKHFLHAGMMSMDPYSGHIKAWVGGINYKYFKYDHVKQARRQPGSTFKPFVYAAAFDTAGYSPCDKMVDRPVIVRYEEDGEQKVWSPHNADWVFTYDTMTLRHAMARSINSVAAQLTEKIGWTTVANYARKLGITSPLKEVPSIGLGSNDVTVYEMTGAYAAFVNEGIWTEPTFITRIEDKNGKIIEHFMPERRRAVSQETAFLMLHMLKGGVQEPGGTSLNLWKYMIPASNEVGGKTGTSTNHADGWYMGVTKDLVTGTWVGGDDAAIHFRTSDYGEGSKMAMPVFGLFMSKLYERPELDITKGAFPKPNVKIQKSYLCPTRWVRRDTTATDSSATGLLLRPPMGAF